MGGRCAVVVMDSRQSRVKRVIQPRWRTASLVRKRQQFSNVIERVLLNLAREMFQSNRRVRSEVPDSGMNMPKPCGRDYSRPSVS